jgi:hypothetical protein
MNEPTEGDTLVRIIQRTAMPGPAPIEGGSGGVVEYFPEGKCLVVVENTAGQYQIQTLLEELRAAKRSQEKK